MRTVQLAVSPPNAITLNPVPAASVAQWREGLRGRIETVLEGFVGDRCDEYVRGVPSAGFVRELLTSYLAGGKYIRSAFTCLGWLCGAGETPAALRAAASIELVHAFALMQDDVMDRSAVRRGQPAAHVRLAGWHREQNRVGDAGRFGESAAILLGDLCLVWADRMLRESGLDAAALARGWPVYDTLRGELAVGQFADLWYDTRHLPTMEAVLDMSRRKSGNYTVRRPLELGAALAGCDQPVRDALSRYGTLIGEAFQLRDDLLDIFGPSSATGKPTGGDLREHKATSVVTLAAELAGPASRAEFGWLCAQEALDESMVARLRELIEETGAADRIEQMIGSRVQAALASLCGIRIGDFPLTALRDLAAQATGRVR